jgi:hypothetical protein
MTAPIDIESLVKQVVEAVTDRLADPQPETPAGGRIFLLLPLPSRVLSVLKNQVSHLSRRGHEIAVFEGVTLENASLPNLLERMNPKDQVVLGTIGFQMARDILEIKDNVPIVRLLTQAALAGSRVWVVTDDLSAPEGNQGALAFPGEQVQRDLQNMGFLLVRAEELASALLRSAPLDTTLSRTIDGLLSETDVVKLYESGERALNISRKTVLTPLAKSRADLLGLKIVREET